MKPDFSKYINIKYKHKGRDFTGCDCFGLIYIIYKQERNIELPNYLDINYGCYLNEKEEDHIEKLYDYNTKNKWIIATLPYRLWDCLIFYASQKKVVADHIGMYIGDGKFIHTSAGLNISLVSRLDKFWSTRVYGGARYIGRS
jgi:cell wall-associated NlpC family hydrolase